MAVSIAKRPSISKRHNYSKLIGADGVKCEIWYREINGVEYEFQRIEREETVAFFVAQGGKFIHNLRCQKGGD